MVLLFNNHSREHPTLLERSGVSHLVQENIAFCSTLLLVEINLYVSSSDTKTWCLPCSRLLSCDIATGNISSLHKLFNLTTNLHKASRQHFHLLPLLFVCPISTPFHIFFHFSSPRSPLHLTLSGPLRRQIACAGAARGSEPSFIVVPVTSS